MTEAVSVAVRSRGGWIWHVTWRLLWFFVHSTVRLLWVRRYVGRHHIPREGAYLFAANHQSFLDPVVAGIGDWRRVRFIARKSLLERSDGSVSTMKQRLAELFHVIPIDRDRGGRLALREGLACLRAGHALMLFPEGTRSPPDEVREFRAGVGLLALRSGVPVVPVAVCGTADVWPRGKSRPRVPRRVVTIAYGEPVIYQKPQRAEDVASDLRRRVLDLRAAVANDGAAGDEIDGDGPPTGGTAGS